jgi:hypothetical protein
MVKMHAYAREYVRKNMAEQEADLFDELYPGPDPRYCFVNRYGKGTCQSIIPHKDQVSFLSIVVALQGDHAAEEKEDCLGFSVKHAPKVGDMEYFKLNSGDAIIFERLYHSILPRRNRKSERVTTMNIFF